LFKGYKMRSLHQNLAAKANDKYQVAIPMVKPVIENDEIEAVTAVLKSGNLVQGEIVREFEEAFADFIGTEYAIAVNSGTAALHIALLAYGVGKEDEVITSPFSFISTANSVLFTGGKPVFADIDKATFNITADNINEKITPRTKAIMPVHLFGQCCDMGQIVMLAEDYGIPVIEDSCQAHGAEFGGKKAGSFGTGCFSFYPTKNMTTGEGGMITTNDKKIAEKARLIRSHGQKERYFHEILGFNFRMTDIAAAIGIYQLSKLEDLNQKRINNASYLTEGINNIRGLLPPVTHPAAKHVFHQYTVRVTGDYGISRDKLMARLAEHGIASQIYYVLPIYRQPIYQKLGYDDHLLGAETAAAEVLSLPVHPSLTRGDLDYIVNTIIGMETT
jgi:perosamine synthetase